MSNNYADRKTLGLAETAPDSERALAAAADYASTRYQAEIDRRRADLAFITVDSQRAVALIRDLRDTYGFAHLAFLTAVDAIEQGVFRLVYMLHNPTRHVDAAVQTAIPREGSSMESIHRLWAQAGTYQRELKEMFGIDFPGSPRVDEPFILEGWDDIPPMRREFDTKEYSERTYFPRPGRRTTETKAHMKAELYPEPEDDSAPSGEGGA